MDFDTAGITAQDPQITLQENYEEINIFHLVFGAFCLFFVMGCCLFCFVFSILT